MNNKFYKICIFIMAIIILLNCFVFYKMSETKCINIDSDIYITGKGIYLKDKDNYDFIPWWKFRKHAPDSTSWVAITVSEDNIK